MYVDTQRPHSITSERRRLTFPLRKQNPMETDRVHDYSKCELRKILVMIIIIIIFFYCIFFTTQVQIELLITVYLTMSYLKDHPPTHPSSEKMTHLDVANLTLRSI